MDGGNTVHLYSRNAEDQTPKFPDIVAALPGWLAPGTESVVIDGEAVARDPATGKIQPFQVGGSWRVVMGPEAVIGRVWRPALQQGRFAGGKAKRRLHTAPASPRPQVLSTRARKDVKLSDITVGPGGRVACRRRGREGPCQAGRRLVAPLDARPEHPPNAPARAKPTPSRCRSWSTPLTAST
jgi:hypothetical protein